MKTNCIEFNKLGHEPFFDFLKAYAIICVLISHTCYTLPFINKLYPFLWLEMQVPIFVLIQAFHVLKKTNNQLSIKKLFKRIILPFLIIQFTIFILNLIKDANIDYNQIINVLIYGGYGPGAYYPWVYIQLAIILYFLRPLFNKGNFIKTAIIWIAVCECFEIIESCINMHEYIHRLTAIRYLFLIFLAWVWIKKGIVINKTTLTLSIISMMSIFYFGYYHFNNEPFFYNTNWSYHRWPCYFYIAFLFCYLLNILYKKISKVSIIDNAIRFLAKYSYDIFLVQMAIIAVVPNCNFIENKNLAIIIWIMLVWTISLLGGYLFSKTYSYFLK